MFFLYLNSENENEMKNESEKRFIRSNSLRYLLFTFSYVSLSVLDIPMPCEWLFMNGQENIRLSDFINVAKDAETNTWSERSTTVLASSTGVLQELLKK